MKPVYSNYTSCSAKRDQTRDNRVITRDTDTNTQHCIPSRAEYFTEDEAGPLVFSRQLANLVFIHFLQQGLKDVYW